MKLEFRILSMRKVVVIANKIIILNPENEEIGEKMSKFNEENS